MEPDNSNFIHYRRTGIAGVTLLVGNGISFQKEACILYPAYAIKVSTEGLGPPFRYKGRLHDPCDVGDVTIFDPFEPIVASSESSYSSFRILLFEKGMVDDMLWNSESPKHDAFARHRQRGKEPFAVLSQLVKNLVTNAPNEETEELVYVALDMLLAESGAKDGGDSQKTMGSVRELILDRISENISLSELESAFRLSRYTLVRNFKTRFGLPPHQFGIHARVALACKLLLEGKAQIDTALDLGFFDQSHMNHHFRKIVGISPGSFSKQT